MIARQSPVAAHSRFRATSTGLLALTLILVALLGVPGEADGARPQPRMEATGAESVIVRFTPQASFNVAAQGVAHLRAGARRARGLRGMPGYDLVTIPRGSSAEQVMRRYLSDPAVLYAEPDYPVSITAVPDDPRFGDQWALENTGQSGGTPGADIEAADAWDLTTGGGDVLVAVVDTGVDYEHPDLSRNMWSGLGWNIAEGNSDPMDIHGHGTHVAGTVAAAGDDGFGVAGVAWDAQIMALKALRDDGSGLTSDIAEAVTFASHNGADIISMSLGGPDYSQTMYDAIAASDALVVAAAGNSGENNDATPYYPASYHLDNIVAVAATDHTDTLTSWSNYGASSVDIAAPGSAILSTLPGATYTATNVLFDKFDTLTGWSTDYYQYHPWALSATWYASSSHSAGHAPGGGFVANEESWIETSDYVSLLDADRVAVRFKARLDTVSSEDWLVLAARPEGISNWTPLAVIAGATGEFRSYALETTSIAGTRAQFAFIFMGGAVGGSAGVWVDDFAVDSVVRDGGADYGNAHGYKSGTSMAAPHVAGVAALLKAYSPGLDAAGLKTAILESAEPLASLSGKTVTGSRLDAAAALAAVDPPNSAPVARDVSYVAEAGVELVIAAPGVLGNDTDDDGDALSAELLTGTAMGELSLEPSGAFTYTPAHAYLGSETFVYRAYDGVDYSEHASVSISVVDTVDPVSSISLDPATPDGLEGWYVTRPVATVEAVDAGSGVDYVEWRVDAGQWTRGGTVSGLSDGEHMLEYRAVDVAGNVERARSVGLKIDTTTPVTLSNALSEYNGIATVTLDAADDASGVKDIYYRLDEASAARYDGPIVVEEPGEYALAFWSTDAAGNVEPEQNTMFLVTPPTQSTTILHDDGGVTYGRWVKGYNPAYAGGGYAYSRWAGEWLEVSFVGTKITWYGPKQPMYGMADVYLNGVKVGSVDQYAPEPEKSLRSVVFELSGLDGKRVNTLRIRLEGASNPDSTGKIVVVDCFEIEEAAGAVRTVRFDERGGHTTLSGPWITATNSSYFDRGYAYSRYPKASYKAMFAGTKVAWIGPRTGSYGRARVYVDGAFQGTVSQFGPTGWRYKVWESRPLASGVHTLEIIPTGTKDSASAGTNVVIDAIDVTP